MKTFIIYHYIPVNMVPKVSIKISSESSIMDTKIQYTCNTHCGILATFCEDKLLRICCFGKINFSKIMILNFCVMIMLEIYTQHSTKIQSLGKKKLGNIHHVYMEIAPRVSQELNSSTSSVFHGIDPWWYLQPSQQPFAHNGPFHTGLRLCQAWIFLPIQQCDQGLAWILLEPLSWASIRTLGCSCLWFSSCLAGILIWAECKSSSVWKGSIGHRKWALLFTPCGM